MSSNINDSPTHFIVLNAISQNYNTIDKISKFSKFSKNEIEVVIKELKDQRLISSFEKKKLIFGKQIQYKLTETGLKMLDIKKQELEEKMRQVQQWYSQGDKAQLQSFMEYNRGWMPMMMLSGIMNMFFFMSMMSFVGMALNPMESSIAGDAGVDSANVDSSSGTDGSGDVGTENVDLQGDGGGFDFDGGGFDSF